MTIRNPNAKPVDWQAVMGSDREWVCDIDGMMERNGHFLFLEWKVGDEQLGRGQEIALENLAKVEKHRVVIVRGDADKVTVRAWKILGSLHEFEPCDNAKLLKYMRDFWAYADRLG